MANPRTTPKKITPTPDQIRSLEGLSRIILSIIIGLSLNGLFIVVVLVILYSALISHDDQRTVLLNTVLPLVTTAIGAVIGYAFGKSSLTRR